MMVDKTERTILDMIEKGQITAEEGLRLINAMGSPKESTNREESENIELVEPIETLEQEPEAYQSPISAEEKRRLNQLKRWWILPFGVGLLITILGAVWMFNGYNANGFSWGFWLSWIPFLIGILIVSVSFQSSHSVWLHVRIKQKPGQTPQRIAISLPMPLGLVRWFLRTFGHRISGLKDQPVSAYADILENLSAEEPFYVHVDDEDGEEVEVFIG